MDISIKAAAIADFINDHDEVGAKLLLKMEGDLEKAKYFISKCFMGRYQSIEQCVQDIFCQINPDLKNPAYEITMAWDIFKYGCFSIEVEDFLYVFSWDSDEVQTEKSSEQSNE